MKKLLGLSLILSMALFGCLNTDANDDVSINLTGSTTDTTTVDSLRYSSSFADTLYFSSSSIIIDTSIVTDTNRIDSNFFIDVRDGQKYRYVTIGRQTWMAENMNYKTITDSWCYDDSNANCEIYGRLYTWDSTRNACPNGWVVPNDKDWEILLNFVGGSNIAGKMLKSDTWGGIDSYGFAALPGGFRHPMNGFEYIGTDANWWTRTPASGGAYYFYYTEPNSTKIGKHALGGWDGRSVRCITSESSSADSNIVVIDTNSFIDVRDNRTYRSVTIGRQTWMAENLKYETINNSWCYRDSTVNCNIYGRLYTWNAADSACPKDWHLPQKSDWDSLVVFVGGFDIAGKVLKSEDAGGTNDYGFSAEMGGFRHPSNGITYIGIDGNWWTSTASGNGYYFFGMKSDEDSVYSYVHAGGDGRSVRCIKD
jgi:uncharacterized protein (TIGR02145 family)